MFDIPAAISSVSGLIEGILDRVWPNPTDVDKAKIKVLKMEIDRELKILTAQTDINLKEAAHGSIFVSGWRPFIGWVCGVGLLYAAILEPIMRFTGTVAFEYVGDYPLIDTSLTMQILLGMLGLGAMRTTEKIKKVAREK